MTDWQDGVRVVIPPGGSNTRHHHGRHEVALYVVRGRGEVRRGDRLESGRRWGPAISSTLPPASRIRN